MNFSYTLLRSWAGAGQDCVLAWGLLPHQKLLLLSDGSMTLDLELLFNSRVDVEVRFKGITTLTPDGSGYLEEDPGEKTIEREVWLTTGEKKLVYAHSLIPLSCVDKALLKELEDKSDEPLGRVLSANKVFFLKEKLEVGIVRCAQAAADLSIDPDSALVARRYILFNRHDNGAGVIKAAVTEIFSPEVISAPSLSGA